MHNVAVIGAGVIGLASAVNIQNKLPEAKVRIIADRFDQDTTSWGAGGIFRPTAKHLHGVDLKRIRKWLRDGWDFYSSLATSEHAGESGMQIVSGFILYKEEPEVSRIPFQFKLLSHTHSFFGGSSTCKSQEGGEIEQRKVSDLNEFVGTYDIVVNCTGLGSKDLIGDNSVYPVRGQLVRVRAPWIKKFVYTDDDTYIYPK
ncbi:hypothetical protein FSP39_024250 [Pinctada imbricata]|uniref:FAD dependent oxidoreductase domain-containing protein n=1 Tax=Pinctada imbricata TaxID=66713 RepID=A0AA89BTK7_PINIB|nr:hypothetical protein FSP39_024250 [Pinctada imbricata]